MMGLQKGGERMTNKEAKAIIRKEYLCVDRDCDIERSCGRCDLMMPSKEPILEAFRMAMDLLDRNATTKDCLGVDAISRKDAINALGYDIEITSDEGLVKYKSEIKEMLCKIYDVQKEQIEKLPSVNPTKTGHWNCGDDMFEYAICSSCKHETGEAWEYAKRNFKFCPNCGSYNGGDDNGNE